MEKKVLLHLFSKTPKDEPGVSPKSYPIEFCNLLVKLLKEKNFHITQIGVSGEIKLSGADEVLFDQKLLDIKKRLFESDFFISVDSFLQHMAWYYGYRKGIVIYSKSDPDIFGHKCFVNLLKDKKYLRKNQFGFWDKIEIEDKAFVTPYKIIHAIETNFN